MTMQNLEGSGKFWGHRWYYLEIALYKKRNHGSKMILDANQYPKSVYFLGAGFSVLAGVPTFSNFHYKAEDIFKQLPDNDINKMIFKKILKHWIENFKDSNIEQYYAAIEMREMLINKHKDDHSKKFTNYLETFIYLTIQKSLNLNTISEFVYFRFFSDIINQNEGVITTNWDTVLESPYDTQYERSNTFLEDGSINYGGIKPYNDKTRIRDPMESCILKLHGSLNWGYCQKCDEIVYFDETIDFFNLNEVECRKCKEEKLQRILIPPTLSKLTKAPSQLVSIWRKAYTYLKFCEKLYFIGYSFPETDVQMKLFISGALNENSNLKEITVVTNKKHGKSKVDFEERYLSILPRNIEHNQIEFFDDGFKKFREPILKKIA